MKSLPKEIVIESTIDKSFHVERLERSGLNTKIPNRLGYHRILLVERGTGLVAIDDKVFEIAGNAVFLLAKGQIYSFESTTITGYMLYFGDCFWEKTPSSISYCKTILFNNTEASQCLLPNDTQLSDIAFLFSTLLKEQQAHEYNNQVDVFAAYLKIIMVKLANVKTTDSYIVKSEDYILYSQFMDLLSKNYSDYHEVNDYAKILKISARRLSDLCKRYSNQNAKEIVNSQIVTEAKRSLRFSSNPVKEIAYQLCFSSAEQFSHFFKKNTNLSPASYRRASRRH